MKTKEIVLCALFSAIICVSAFFTFPLPFTPVPITFQVMAVCVAGAILGPRLGVISVLIYCLMGLIGLPVFSGMKGGPSVLVGPTGGFIFGFFVASYVIGFLTKKIIVDSDSTYKKTVKYFISMLLGLFFIYSLGLIQYMILTSTPVINAVMLVIIPFIIADLFKIVLGTFLAVVINKNIKFISI